MQGERKTLTQLSVPICLETLFYMLSGMVDTLMLSSVSDQAVGAVGTANTYIGVFIIMFGVISSGMVAVMSQNIGAGRPGIAYQARQLGLVFNALTGILISVVLAVFSGGILRAVSIAPALLESAETYLKIVGGASFLNALIPIFSSYLRVFGYTKHSLIGTVVGNVINIILNSVFLFVFHWGVMGVATATVISPPGSLWQTQRWISGPSATPAFRCRSRFRAGRWCWCGSVPCGAACRPPWVLIWSSTLPGPLPCPSRRWGCVLFPAPPWPGTVSCRPSRPACAAPAPPPGRAGPSTSMPPLPTSPRRLMGGKCWWGWRPGTIFSKLTLSVTTSVVPAPPKWEPLANRATSANYFCSNSTKMPKPLPSGEVAMR